MRNHYLISDFFIISFNHFYLSFYFFTFVLPNKKGEVLEWLKRYAWKAYVLQKGTGGSNPFLSAKYTDNQQNKDRWY